MIFLILADDSLVQRSIARNTADVVLSCGDISDDVILDVSQMVGCHQILAVKGNHDSSNDFPPQILDLHFTVHRIRGVAFGGFRGCWQYKPNGNYLFEQSEVDRLMKSFPPVDVFIAHNSPRFVHDRDDNVHYGFDAFGRYIDRAQPKYFIHGHQHVNCQTMMNKTCVIGVYGYKWLEYEFS
jgi:uncharacterized protein